MLGAIAGDIIGSVYEQVNIRTKEFPLFQERSCFTDDTVLTLALAESLLTGEDFIGLLKSYARKYPRAGYGGTFVLWAMSSDREPYNSWGNGSAMRVSPIAYAFQTLEEVLEQSARSASVTHNHPEGVKGAQAIASAIFLARTGSGKEEIGDFITETFGYDLTLDFAGLQASYRFDVSCQGSVPQAIIAFLESEDYEDTIRNAVAIGGDTDTIACMSGGIAEAFYGGVPTEIRLETLLRLDTHLRSVVSSFESQFML